MAGVHGESSDLNQSPSQELKAVTTGRSTFAQSWLKDQRGHFLSDSLSLSPGTCEEPTERSSRVTASLDC